MLPWLMPKNVAQSDPGFVIQRCEEMASQSDLISLCCRFDEIRFQRQGVEGWSDGRCCVFQRQRIEWNGREEGPCALEMRGNLDTPMN
jgi:hypothetical protein